VSSACHRVEENGHDDLRWRARWHPAGHGVDVLLGAHASRTPWRVCDGIQDRMRGRRRAGAMMAGKVIGQNIRIKETRLEKSTKKQTA